MPIDLRFDPDEAPLLIDLYELTMAASYYRIGFDQPACFYLSVRRMPAKRGFLVAAGIERVLEALEDFHFEAGAIEYLDSLKLFTPEFLTYLSTLRFTGDVYAVPEGTIFFEQEPILEVRAPLIEAQIIETLLLNQIGTASMIASKAARCVVAARGRYGIPLNGTMAHSYIMAHDNEREAFNHFVTQFPQLGTLLVDTYDTVRGVENAVRVARDLRDKGYKLQAVRLDSGDLTELSNRARRILDQSGLKDVAIFASGNLDEYRINELIRAGAP